MQNNELGNLREDFGELRGTVMAIKVTTERLERKIDESQKDAIAAHTKLGTAINKLQTQLDVSQGVKKRNNTLLGHAWTAFYTMVAAIAGGLATWFTTGSGGAHP